MHDHRKIYVDPQLRDLIPALDADTLSGLQESLKRDGCLDSLKVWADGERCTLLDGHNRFEICEREGIPYQIEVVRSVSNLHEAKIWMIELQLARRNLTAERKAYLQGKRYHEEKNDQGGDRKSKGHDVLLINTAEKIASECEISDRTVKRNADFAAALDAMPEGERNEILSGKSKRGKKEIILDYKLKSGEVKKPHRLNRDQEKLDYFIAARKAADKVKRTLEAYQYSADVCEEIIRQVITGMRNCNISTITDNTVDSVWRECIKASREQTA